MSYQELPDESKALVDKIVKDYEQDRKEIVEHYWKISNQSMIKGAKGKAAQHEWVRRILKSEFEDRPPAKKTAFVVLGKGPIQYSKKSNSINSYLLVFDANSREIKNLVFRGKDVALMDEFQCFDKYKNVMCGSGDDGTLFGDDRMNPIPQGTPTGKTASEFFKIIKVKEVSMGTLDAKGNMSEVGSAGWPIRTDIRCLRKCLVVRSYSGVITDWKHFEVKRANMFLKDDRNDFEGYTDTKGLEWPNKATFWCNPEFVQPKYSEVNVWAVMSRHKESGELGGEVIYVEPVHIADDTD